MQIIYKNKDERDISRRINTVGSNIYTEEISSYLEGKNFGELRN